MKSETRSDILPRLILSRFLPDDIDASLKKAAELGGRIIVPNTPIPGVRWFGMFADPEGNLLGVFKGAGASHQ